VVATLVGRAIDPEQPLMEAGLDSLGEYLCIETRMAPSTALGSTLGRCLGSCQSM
jgi:hypothetical protein